MLYAIIVLTLIIILAVMLLIRHQRTLLLRAHFMREAIRNHDFMFRLPTKGLLPGERAMQETLNQLGDTIRQQVSENEVESWERLTRVLTHEIMNAIAPISSISQSLLTRGDVKGTPLEEGIRAIHSTSQHLNAFVDSYRKLSQLQQPVMQDVPLQNHVKDIMTLYPDIQWECDIPDDIIVHADPNMLRQILINLVKNAIEAKAKRISLNLGDNTHSLHPKGTTLTLYISNDGAPIPAEAIRSIFVPFFTTKRTGNGIGLSLSRSMMMQQGGSLNLENNPHRGYHTTFSLEW